MIPYGKVKIESGEKFKNPYSREYTREEIEGKLGTDALLADPEKMKALAGANIFISPLEKFRVCPVCKYYLCENCFDTDDFHDILNHESLSSQIGIAEGPMRLLQKGDFIQLQRKGFYYVDKLEVGGDKITLNYTPDGKAKNEPKVKGPAPPAKVKEEAKPVGELSKKELNKLKKKE